MTSFGIIIFVIAWYACSIIGWWKIFDKAGEPGWEILIPFYGVYVIFDISWEGRKFWLYIGLKAAGLICKIAEGNGSAAAVFFYLILSSAVFIYEIVLYYKLADAFGHGIGYVVGILLLKPVFLMIIGLGSSKYRNIYGYEYEPIFKNAEETDESIFREGGR